MHAFMAPVFAGAMHSFGRLAGGSPPVPSTVSNGSITGAQGGVLYVPRG
jgi:hypothetical protein